jgi:hypothetical protein
MSALGQKGTLDRRLSMSALPPKADIAGCGYDVRFVPKADILRGLRDVRFTPESGHGSARL